MESFSEVVRLTLVCYEKNGGMRWCPRSMSRPEADKMVELLVSAGVNAKAVTADVVGDMLFGDGPLEIQQVAVGQV